MAGGGDDNHPHDPAASSSTPAPSIDPDASKKSAFTLQKTGEVMLVFALVIIFVVVFCVSMHLVLKQRRQQRQRNGGKTKKEKKKKKKGMKTGNTPELHSVEKKVFEAAGTQVVLCELPEDAPPLQELDAGDVPFDFGFTRRGSDTTTSDLESNSDEIMDEITPMDPWPNNQQLAMYWAGR